jgi:tetratricopeptide (TPR) repeat protein
VRKPEPTSHPLAPEGSFSVRERVALALVALAPAAFLPGGLNRFVFLKVAMVAVAIALAAAGRRRGRLPRAIAAAVAAGALLLAVAAGLSVAPAGAFFGRAPRYEGIFILPVYAGAAAAGAWLLGPAASRRALPWWLRALSLGVALVAFEAVLEAFGLRPLASNVARPGSLLGNASDEGAYGVLCLGILTSVAVRVRDRWAIAGAAASGLVVVLSASRGALLGAAVALACIGVLVAAGRLRLLVLASLALLTVATFAVPATRDRVLGTSPLAGSTISGRTLLWDESLHLVASHPVLGVGPSGYLDALPAEHDRQWQTQIGPANPPDSPHDWILQAAADGGFPLALLAIGIVLEVARRGRRTLRAQQTDGGAAAFTGMIAGGAGYGVALLFHFTSPGTTPLAAFAAGALVAVPPDGGLAWWQGRAARRMLATGAGLLAVVLLAAALAETPLRAAIVAVSQGRYSAAANDFRIARDLRPWDGEVGAAEAHAFVVAAQQDAAAGPSGSSLLAGALALAGPAARTEAGDYPRSVAALQDLASVEELSGALGPAGATLERALGLDPLDPQILLSLGVVAGEEGRDGQAVARLMEAAGIDKTSPAPWLDLAVVYQQMGDPSAAAAARAKAAALAG